MSKETISINRALAELKLLDKRIKSKIVESKFVTENKKSADKVERVYTRDEFNKNAKASLQGVKDLIARRNSIKSAIVESNANTIVEISGVKCSVADAIERKSSIEYDQLLLNELKKQYRYAQSVAEDKNEDVEITLNQLLTTMVGKDNIKNIDVQSNDFAKQYLKDNEYEIIDPIGIETVINDLEKDIEDFLLEVDYILTESNSITKIEI